MKKAAKGKRLDGRHRDVSGRIDKKHGNTRVGTLRRTYGDHFAKGRRSDMMLKNLLAEVGVEFSSRLLAQASQIVGAIRGVAGPDDAWLLAGQRLWGRGRVTEAEHRDRRQRDVQFGAHLRRGQPQHG